MEAMKIESLADLDLKGARYAVTTITAHLDSLGSISLEDVEATGPRLAAIAQRIGELAAALRIASPNAQATLPEEHDRQIRELTTSVQRHRETERRHRDQRARICEVLQATWSEVEPRVKELLDDRRAAIDMFGEVRAAAAAAGIDQDMRPLDMMRRLTEERRELLVALADDDALLNGASLPDSVRRLAEERRELLEEMARGADPEKVAAAASGLAEPPLDPPLGPSCENCHERLCRSCNRCHSFSRETRCVLADPPCGPEPTPVILPGALRIAHEALVAVISASERDWTRAADLAWIYGVLVGWSPDDLEELQIRFGWREQTASIIDEHRAALVCAGMVE
ncbi:MAG TPA: hypothetical protein VLB44_01220 [Kofleriaceae bacterium]|nr:hypothetical protein [Kofleriaceae bacterium]